MKRQLHNAIAETLSALREEGTELIVNLEFYEMVKRQIKMRTYAPSSRSIALYMIRHRNEFMVRFGDKNRSHTRRNILIMSPESYYGKEVASKFIVSRVTQTI